MPEHYNTILRQSIDRIDAPREGRPVAAEAFVSVTPLRGDALKLNDMTSESLDACHVELVKRKCSLAATVSSMLLFSCSHTRQSVARLLDIGMSDEGESSMRSLFQGLDTTEVDK